MKCELSAPLAATNRITKIHFKPYLLFHYWTKQVVPPPQLMPSVEPMILAPQIKVWLVSMIVLLHYHCIIAVNFGNFFASITNKIVQQTVIKFSTTGREITYLTLRKKDIQPDKEKLKEP